jgi:hypothetical protein
VAADPTAPQAVRLRRRDGQILATFWGIGWIACDLRCLDPEGVAFARREDLVIEGEGLGRPYWNDERPTWLVAFDSHAQTQHIAVIREAVQREINRALIATTH